MNVIKAQTIRVLKETYSNADSFTVTDFPCGTSYLTFKKLDFANNKRLANQFKVGPRGKLEVIGQEFNQHKI